VTTIQYPAPTDRTYYVAGPIGSGSEMRTNLERFVYAVNQLRERGYLVVSPVEFHDMEFLDDPTKKPHDWAWYLRRDIELMVADEVTGIILLPGWEYSKGANLELQVARGLNYYITTLGECLARPVKVTVANDYGRDPGTDGRHSASPAEIEGAPATSPLQLPPGNVGLALGPHEDRSGVVPGGDQLDRSDDRRSRDPR
jgi:Domain of unknown function (DUF4406)